MSLLLRLIGMLVGFSTVMLAASLVVMCAVRAVQYLANLRGQTLGEMLGSLNLGYRSSQRDDGRPGDAPQNAFVVEVLSYPALHPTSRLESFPLGGGLTPAKADKNLQNIVTKVDHLPKEALIDIVCRIVTGANGSALGLAELQAQAGLDPVLPERWSSRLPPERRTLRSFVAYVDTWYETLEGVSREHFKRTSKRLASVVSCFLVVLINLDGLRLASDLLNDTTTQERLAAQAQAVLNTADQLDLTRPVTDRDALLQNTTQTLRQMNGVLNEPALAFGWQNSWIVKEWCVHAKPGGQGFPVLDTLRWLVGLMLSCLLLSLGAPFWADRLKDLLGFRNSLAPGGSASSGRAASP